MPNVMKGRTLCIEQKEHILPCSFSFFSPLVGLVVLETLKFELGVNVKGYSTLNANRN